MNTLYSIILNDTYQATIESYLHSIFNANTPYEFIQFYVVYTAESWAQLKNFPSIITSIQVYNSANETIAEENGVWEPHDIALMTTGQEVPLIRVELIAKDED